MSGKKFAVFGVGKYGSEIAGTLAKKGAEVHAFDTNEEKIEQLKEEVALAVTLDSTDKKNLIAQGVQNVEAAVVAIGENFEATVLTCLNLIDLKIPRIIARASGENQLRILKSIGITEILNPELEVATLLSERLINPSITGVLQLPDNFEIAEIKAPRGIADRNLGDIRLAEKYTLNLITVKREFEVLEKESGQMEKEEHIIGIPKDETVIYETDTLVVFGSLQNIKRFIEINQ